MKFRRPLLLGRLKSGKQSRSLDPKTPKASPKKGEKRSPSETLDELYGDAEVADVINMPAIEPPVLPPTQVGGGSGSAAPGADISHQAFWSPVVQPQAQQPPSASGGAEASADTVSQIFLQQRLECSEQDASEIAQEFQIFNVDIAEIFSPPHFTTMAENYGLKPGFAVDLETGWDLTKKIDVFTLKHKVQLDDPMLLTG